MKRKYIVSILLLIAAVLLFSEYGSYSLAYLVSKDFRSLIKQSHEDEMAFKHKLQDKIAEGKTEIYLRDLTSFGWNEVCYLYEYSNVRQTLVDNKMPTGNLMNTLAITNMREGEEGFVFLNEGKILALLRGGRYNHSFKVGNLTSVCTTVEKAKFIPVSSASFYSQKNLGYKKASNILQIRTLPRCINLEECTLIFWGE